MLVSFANLFLKFLGIIMVIAASLSLLVIFTFMFGIGLHEMFDIYLGNPFWPEIDIMHAGVSVCQTVFVGLIIVAVPVIYVFLIGRFFIDKKPNWRNCNTSHFTWDLVVCSAAHDRDGLALYRWFYELSIAAK